MSKIKAVDLTKFTFLTENTQDGVFMVKTQLLGPN